jgi:hypothetical protein
MIQENLQSGSNFRYEPMYIITEGRYVRTGLKTTNIENQVKKIIDDANNFIVLCGYSFTPSSNAQSILNKLIASPITNKHCIMPIKLYRGYDANKPHALDLIRNGVSVSIEVENHSKWLMTEGEIFYGSANFTNYSLTTRLEVVSFRKFKRNDPLRNQFGIFTLQSMNQMRLRANRANVQGLINRNRRLMNQTIPLIQRYNPSIRKVKNTLKNMFAAKVKINELLANNYWIIENKYYDKLIEYTLNNQRLINRIGRIGSEIIFDEQNGLNIGDKLDYYNSLCDESHKSLDEYYSISREFILNETQLPDYSTRNKELIYKNVEKIKTQWKI